MQKCYTTGEFAKRAKVTIRTIRYYDKKVSYSPASAMMRDIGCILIRTFKTPKVLSLKYLGFSLEEIKNMTINDDVSDITKSLQMQADLLHKKAEHLKLMEEALLKTTKIIEETSEVDWNEILGLIHMTSMERTLVEHYQNSTNLDIRISLHDRFSVNKQGWFPWLFLLWISRMRIQCLRSAAAMDRCGKMNKQRIVRYESHTIGYLGRDVV